MENTIPQYALVFTRTDNPNEERRIPYSEICNHPHACPSMTKRFIELEGCTVIETTNDDHVLTLDNLEEAVVRFWNTFDRVMFADAAL